ncbi:MULTISPECIES: DUF4270 domain-containing protein [Flavobacterium]|uniref:DUF4270 domain-containing protein n=1 Tax=Flavobacterium jumunjinense TaxID=998845 RepID=A0ABV5GLK4_9FLAO|nr:MULTISPECIES: DUF4270 domain-containing protein [Flavobacterium]
MKKIVSKIALMLSIVAIVSCDKDFNTIGSDVIGDDHFGLEKKEDVTLVAYTKATGAVQSNNLPTNSLGIYSDGYFGESKSTFVSQLELSSVSPDFGIEIDIQANDSVYLYVPYFNKQTATGSGNDANTFELQSIYGEYETASFDLKIYENKYYLRSFDAIDPSVSQKYYSDQKDDVEGLIVGDPHLNDGANVVENTEFRFKKEEIIIYKTDGNGAYLDSDGAVTTDLTKRVVKERLTPGMWINLNKDFFENRILNASDADLVNNNVFKEYLKGIYFKVDANSSPDSNVLAMLDFSRAYINIQYHSKAALTTDELKKKAFKLNLKGNTVNFFENTSNVDYVNAIGSPNETIGDEFLYPKGGDGSVVFIDLFGPDVDGDLIPDELKQLRDENILINDAYLTFIIKNNGQKNPTRIFLYDAANNIPILDYIFDSSTATDPENNKFFYGGILVKEDDVETKYRIRLSSHINRLIRGTDPDTNKNVRLGLSITQNINNGNRYGIKNAFAGTANKNIPIGSVMSPLGTILYGNTASVSVDKRLKFEIYYTKAN